MAPPDPADVATRCLRAATDPGDESGALNAPLQRSAAFAFADAERAHRVHEGLEPGFFYGRMGNPTVARFEGAMADLEGGEAALATASGMAAMSTLMLSLLRPGDRVLAPRSVYASTRSLLTDLLAPFGIGVDFAAAPETAAFAAALCPKTKLLLAETPANPTLEVLDLAALARLARERGLTSVADNTFATPINQRPLEFGFDLVVDSVTKFLGGHSDLVGGVIVGRAGLIERARWFGMKLLGGVMAPDNAWLALRGLQTLPVRIERHNQNAQTVAGFLAGHPHVIRVHYPGLPSHPGHDLARRQMSGFGGVLSFDVGSEEAGKRLVERLTVFKLAVSLGDVVSLAQHPASMTFAAVGEAARRAAGVTPGLIRLSVGLESARDLIDDLDRALA